MLFAIPRWRLGQRQPGAEPLRPARPRWTRLHDVLLAGEGRRNAYWQAYLDARGTRHLSWVWRETSNVASNHDSGLRTHSVDRGAAPGWRSAGETYPAAYHAAATAEYAARILQNSELINQTSMTADAAGTPYIATYWRPQGTWVPQYQVDYLAGKTWKTSQVSQRTTPFSLRVGRARRRFRFRAPAAAGFDPERPNGRPTCSSAMPSARTAYRCYTALDLGQSPVGRRRPHQYPRRQLGAQLRHRALAKGGRAQPLRAAHWPGRWRNPRKPAPSHDVRARLAARPAGAPGPAGDTGPRQIAPPAPTSAGRSQLRALPQSHRLSLIFHPVVTRIPSYRRVFSSSAKP
ncbi:MAG: BNR-4 repeat-containing protein [Hymenobacter sp.]